MFFHMCIFMYACMCMCVFIFMCVPLNRFVIIVLHILKVFRKFSWFFFSSFFPYALNY